MEQLSRDNLTTLLKFSNVVYIYNSSIYNSIKQNTNYSSIAASTNPNKFNE